MKLKILISLIIISGLFSACSDYEIDPETFLDAFKDIMIVREQINDSAKAEKEIRKIYFDHEISAELFKSDYYVYAESEEEFIKMMDTVRDRVIRELTYIKMIKDSIADADSANTAHTDSRDSDSSKLADTVSEDDDRTDKVSAQKDSLQKERLNLDGFRDKMKIKKDSSKKEVRWL